MNKNLLSVRYLIFSGIGGVLSALILVIAFICARGTVWFWVLLLLSMGLLATLTLAFFFLWRPYRSTTRGLGLLAAWPLDQEHYRMRWPYNKQMQRAMKRIQEQIDALTTMEVNKRQAQYQALQNQINPHFLYNTLESIRSEALLSGLDSVAQMCEALASFFRYTISNMADLVTIEDEIRNIRTYFYIQQYRFGDRLRLQIEYDEADQPVIMKCLIPKLTLQPIVENAIIHGIEGKVGNGTVTIKLVLTEQRLIVVVSDNGRGMRPETLGRINERIHTRVMGSKGKGGIAIGNVNNRIKILFGEAYGVTVYSTLDIGTDVEITLRRTSEQDRSALRREGGFR